MELAELQTIKWLLIAIAIAAVVSAAAITFMAVGFWVASKPMREQHGAKAFRTLANNHLDKGEYEQLIEYSEERLEEFPHDVWAHWFIGQGKYHKGQLPEARGYFERAVELEPSWGSNAEWWYEKISERLAEGPKAVE